MQSFKQLWSDTVEKLPQHLTDTAMNLWIHTIVPIKFENGCAVLLADSEYHREIILSKFRDMIIKEMTDIAGFEVNINVITKEDQHYAKKAKVFTPPKIPKDEIDKLFEPIYPEYTFDTFVVGDSNKHAHASCLAVASNPSNSYNPLFLYGNTGLGKTHLMKAVRNEIMKNFPDCKTIYISGEEFTNELIENIAKKTMSEFKSKYRSVDVLFVDDIQFIAGKDSTQDEFFHTFNALYEAGKQIILASDRPPRDIQLLEARLRSRFEMGIITDIYMPEYELKVAIIKQKARTYGMELPDDVVEFVAGKIKNNIRQLEGVLKKLMAFKLVSNTPPTIALANSAVRDITNENEPIPVIFEKVLKSVSEEFDVSEEDIISKKRIENITFARQVAMYIMREITALSLPDIGKHFNGRDHSTVHHSIRKIESKVLENANLKSRIDEIIRTVQGK